MAELLSGDVDQEILAARIGLADALGEVAHRRRELAIRPSELLEEKGRKRGIGLGYPHRILQSLIMHKHLAVLYNQSPDQPVTR